MRHLVNELSKGQIFNILIDTRSSNLWFPNKNCTTDCLNNNKFNPENSQTFKERGDPWSITYGTGSVSGFTGFTGIDNVELGDVIARDVTIGLADITSADFVDLISSGICGMAFDVLNTMGGSRL